jgi:GGDEF domain-containing protein
MVVPTVPAEKQNQKGEEPTTPEGIMGSDQYLETGDYDKYYRNYETFVQRGTKSGRPGMTTISQLATQKMGYVPTFWQDPYRVSRMYAAIQAAPKGWTPPAWLDVNKVKAAYDWFKFRNTNKPTSEWKWLPADDPGNSFLASMQPPPNEFLWPTDQRYADPNQLAESLKNQPGFDWYTLPDTQRKSILAAKNFDVAQYPRELQDAMRADTNFDWTKLPKWQHTVFNIMSQPIAQGVASSLPMAFAGAVTGGAAGAAIGGAGFIPGAIGGFLTPLIIGAVAGAATGSKWEPLAKGAAVVQQVMMWPGQWQEQQTGLTLQLIWGALDPEKYGSVAEVLTNLKASYQAGIAYQESNAIFPSFINLIPVASVVLDHFKENGFDIRPDHIIGAIHQGVLNGEIAALNQVWIMGSPKPRDQVNGQAAITEARRRIMNGEDPVDVQLDTIAKFGLTGTARGMLQQIISDPLQAVPWGSRQIMKGVGHITGSELLVKATEGPYMTSRGLLGHVQNFFQATGFVSTINRLKALVLSGEYDVKALTPLERSLAGLNKEGGLRWWTPASTKTDLISKVKNLFGLTAESKAVMGQGIMEDNMVAMMWMFGDDVDGMKKYLDGISAGDYEVLKELNTKLTNSPEWYTFLPALKGMKDRIEALYGVYHLADENRATLLRIASILGEEPGKVLDDMGARANAELDLQTIRQKASELEATGKATAESRSLMRAIDTGMLKAEDLASMIKVFYEGDVPWHPAQLKAMLVGAIKEHYADWAMTYFGVSKDSPVFRLAAIGKRAQTLVLLGFNPMYLINNETNNIFTRMATGNFGYMTARQANSFLDRFGITPARLNEGIGMIGDARINDAARRASDIRWGSTGLMRKVYDKLGRLNNKIGIFSKLSGAAERIESKNAFIIDMKRTMGWLWQVGRGIDPLPPELVTALGPDRTELVYRAIQGGMNLDEIKASLSSQQVSIQARTLVMDAARAMGIDGDMALSMLDQLGVLDELDAGFKTEGPLTESKIHAAFAAAEKKAQDAMDLMAGQRAKVSAEQMRNRIVMQPAEITKLLADIEMAYTDRWIDHYEMFGAGFETMDQLPMEMRRLMVEEIYRTSGKEWDRINNNRLNQYAGLIEGLRIRGMDSDQFLAGLAAHDQLWNDAYKFRSEQAAAYWDKYKADWDAPGRYAARDEMKAAISRKFQETYEAAVKQQQRISAAIAKMVKGTLGDAASVVAKTEYDKVIAMREDMWKRIQYFRQTLETIPWDDRHAAWTKFKNDQLYPIIIELQRLKEEGAQAVQRTAAGLPPVEPMGPTAPRVPPVTQNVTPVTPNVTPGEPVKPPPAAPQPTGAARVPVMLTKKMEADLRSLGFTTEQINAMPADQAWIEIKKGGLFDPEVQKQVQATNAEATNLVKPIMDLAAQKGIPLVNKTGDPMNRVLLNVLNKHRDAGSDVFTVGNLAERSEEAQRILAGYTPSNQRGPATAMTEGMRSALDELGYDADYIAKLTPSQAQTLIDGTQFGPNPKGRYQELADLRAKASAQDKAMEAMKKDPMLGIPVKGYVFQDIAAAKTVGVFDVQGLGWMNDTFSHAAGDLLLKLWVEHAQALPEGVSIARAGNGDEFVMYGNIKPQEMKTLLKRLAKDVAEVIVEVRDANGETHYFQGFDIYTAAAENKGQYPGDGFDIAYQDINTQKRSAHAVVGKGQRPGGVVELTDTEAMAGRRGGQGMVAVRPELPGGEGQPPASSRIIDQLNTPIDEWTRARAEAGRLHPSKWPKDLADTYTGIYKDMRALVEAGEPGRRESVEVAGSDGVLQTEWRGIPSSYPDWYGGLKADRSKVLAALENLGNGQAPKTRLEIDLADIAGNLVMSGEGITPELMDNMQQYLTLHLYRPEIDLAKMAGLRATMDKIDKIALPENKAAQLQGLLQETEAWANTFPDGMMAAEKMAPVAEAYQALIEDLSRRITGAQANGLKIASQRATYNMEKHSDIILTKQTVKEIMVQEQGMTPDHADAILAANDSVADAWAKWNNSTPDEFWRQHGPKLIKESDLSYYTDPEVEVKNNVWNDDALIKARDAYANQEYHGEWNDAAVDYFGTTDDPREAGYILDDGRMLDFSGKKDGGPAGTRALDHREIGFVLPETERGNAFADTGTPMSQMGSNTGAIRMSWMSDDVLQLDLYSTVPSSEQIRGLRDAIFDHMVPSLMVVDINSSKGDTLYSISINNPTTEDLKALREFTASVYGGVGSPKDMEHLANRKFSANRGMLGEPRSADYDVGDLHYINRLKDDGVLAKVRNEHTEKPPVAPDGTVRRTDYVEAAIQRFGTTREPRAHGYLLEDGSMVDFNDKGSGRRYSEISQALLPGDLNATDDLTVTPEAYFDSNTGAITVRYFNDSTGKNIGLDIHNTVPSPSQIAALRRALLVGGPDTGYNKEIVGMVLGYHDAKGSELYSIRVDFPSDQDIGFIRDFSHHLYRGDMNTTDLGRMGFRLFSHRPANFYAEPKGTYIGNGAFQEWNRNNKLIDKAGNAVIGYHGALAGFEEFRPSSVDSQLGAAIYITSDPEDANVHYAHPQAQDRLIKLESALDNLTNTDPEDHIPDIARFTGKSEIEIEADIEVWKNGEGEFNGNALNYMATRYGEDEAQMFAGTLIGRTNQGVVMPVIPKMETPLDMTGTGNERFTLDIPMGADGEMDYDAATGTWLKLHEAVKQAADELGVNHKRYAFESERDNRIGQRPSHTLADVVIASIEERFPDWMDQPPLVKDVIKAMMYMPELSGIDGEWNNEWAILDRQFVQEVIKNLGYDGAVLKPVDYFETMYRDMPDTIHYILFNKDQVKSVWNQGTWGKGIANILKDGGNEYRLAPGQPWYSKLQRSIQGISQKIMTAEQLDGMLRTAGIKKDELIYTGLQEWMDGLEQGQKITREEVLSAMTPVQIEEVWRPSRKQTMPTPYKDMRIDWEDASWGGIDPTNKVFYAHAYVPEGKYTGPVVQIDKNNRVFGTPTVEVRNIRNKIGGEWIDKFFVRSSILPDDSMVFASLDEAKTFGEYLIKGFTPSVEPGREPRWNDYIAVKGGTNYTELELVWHPETRPVNPGLIAAAEKVNDMVQAAAKEVEELNVRIYDLDGKRWDLLALIENKKREIDANRRMPGDDYGVAQSLLDELADLNGQYTKAMDDIDISPLRAAAKSARLKFDRLDTSQIRLKNIVDTAERNRGFTSGHWDEPDVLAHARMTDHVEDKTSGKVAMVQEIQTDWIEKGLHTGWATELPAGEVLPDYPYFDFDAYNQRLADLSQEIHRYTEENRQNDYEFTSKGVFHNGQRLGGRRTIHTKGYNNAYSVFDVGDVIINPDGTRIEVTPEEKAVIARHNDMSKRYVREIRRAEKAGHDLENWFTLAKSVAKSNTEGGYIKPPFVNNWHEMVMKRMLKYAADHGYDYLGWTTGMQQSDVNSLTKRISRIYWENATPSLGKEKAEAYYLTVYDLEGDVIVDRKEVQAGELSEYIGEEMTSKVESQYATADEGEFTGTDLEIGSKFHMTLYDELMRSDLAKIAKKYGVVPEDIEVRTDTFTTNMDYHGPDLTASEFIEKAGPVIQEMTRTASTRVDIEGAAIMQKQYETIVNLLEHGDETQRFSMVMELNGSSRMAEIIGGEMRTKYTTDTIHAIKITPELGEAQRLYGNNLFDQRPTYDLMADGRALIDAFNHTDLTTLVRNTWDIFRRTMPASRQGISAADAAKGFADYFQTGKDTPGGDYGVYESWLVGAYRSVKNSVMKVSINPDTAGYLEIMANRQPISQGLAKDGQMAMFGAQDTPLFSKTVTPGDEQIFNPKPAGPIQQTMPGLEPEIGAKKVTTTEDLGPLFKKMADTDGVYGKEAGATYTQVELDLRVKAVEAMHLIGKKGDILALGISKKFHDQGYVPLVNLRFNDYRELATIAQICRNPLYEVGRVIYTKDNLVVGEMATTSRMPGFGTALPEGVYLEPEILRQVAWDLDADGVWYLHNHPSGDSNPSLQDVGVTGWIAKILGPLFKGHVVIDHEEYSTVDRFGRKETFELKNVPTPYNLHNAGERMVHHPLLGRVITSPESAARFAADMGADPNKIMVIGTSHGAVRSVMEITVADMAGINVSLTPERVGLRSAAILRIFAKKTGVNGMLLVNVPHDQNLIPLLRQAIKTDLITDAIFDDGSSFRQNTGTDVDNAKYGMGKELEKYKGIQIGEGASDYKADQPPFDPNAPVGGYDQVAQDRPDEQIMQEGWADHVRPLLTGMKNQAMTQAKNGGSMGGMDADIARQLNGYLDNTVKGNLATAKMAAVRHAESQRDFAMLNYNRRYGFDKYLDVAYPYQFWYGRTMMNWALRALDRPTWFANYARLRALQNTYQRNIPERMRNKFAIPMPFLPAWMGGAVYTDPLRNIFPFASLEQPFTMMQQDQISIGYELQRVLREWADAGTITQEQLAAAQQGQGPIYTKAMAEASTRRKAEINNPIDFMSVIMGPAWYLSAPYYAITGQGNKISPLPVTRTANAYKAATAGTSMQGIGDIIGLLAAPENAIRKATGLSQYGEYGDYYVDRQLANMVADGEITYDQGITAMIQRNGSVFEMARQRVNLEMAAKVPGAMALYAAAHGNVVQGASALLPSFFGGGLLPTGELEYRGLKGEWDEAWANKDRGDTDAVNAFFDKHPEYSAYLAKGQPPDVRMRQYLVGQVWDRYMALDQANKREVRPQLGDLFQEAFLNSETRNYDNIDTSTLTSWARMLGAANLPVVPETQAAMAAPVTPLRGLPPAIDKALNKFYADREAMFPNIMAINDGYYSQPVEGRTAYRAQFPQLKQYWDWKQQEIKDHPELAPFLDQYVAQAILAGTRNPTGMNRATAQQVLANWYPADFNSPAYSADFYLADASDNLKQQVTYYALTGSELGAGARAELEKIWTENGKPGGSILGFLALLAASIR